VDEILKGRICTLFDLRYRPLEEHEPKDAVEAGFDQVVTVPLWEKAQLTWHHPEGNLIKQFEVGACDANSANVRWHGTNRWLKITAGLLNSSSASVYVGLYEMLRDVSPVVYSSSLWDSVLDLDESDEQTREGLAKGDGLGAISLVNAPESWRKRTWQVFGRSVIDRLLTTSKPLPLETAGTALELLAPNALGSKRERIIPWTQSGFERFTLLAVQSTYKWTELNEVSERWFGRGFPKGILQRDKPDSKNQEVTINFRDTGTSIRVFSPWVEKGLAVTPELDSDKVVPEGGFRVTHLRSSNVFSGRFPTAQHAMSFGRYLLTLPVDFEKDFDEWRRTIDQEDLKAVQSWITDQSLAPTTEEVAAYDERRRKS
jgi:hypothetical protein